MDPKLRDLPMIIHFDHFFSTFLKSSFQNPTVLRGVSTPHMPPAKSDYFRNERTEHIFFDYPGLPTDVKSASRKNEIVSESMLTVFSHEKILSVEILLNPNRLLTSEYFVILAQEKLHNIYS